MIENWHKEGIKTIDEAKNRSVSSEKKPKKVSGNKDFSVYNTDQYDFDEIERIAAQKLRLRSIKDGE